MRCFAFLLFKKLFFFSSVTKGFFICDCLVFKNKKYSMKKHVLFIAFICAVSALNAQSFPNGGFENWASQTTYEDPQYWTSMNMMTLFGAGETAIKSTQAHSGTYALKLVTSVSDIGGDGEMDTLPGILILGTSDIMGGTGTTGYPFTQRPDSLVGWYKLISPDNDPFQLQFSSSKWNAGSGSQETIGLASYEGQPSSTYIRFSVPISYTDNSLPDSIQAFIGNATNGSGVTNELYLDDLSFVYNSTAGLEEQNTAIRLYPNPVNDQLFIQSDKPIQQVLLKDLHGKQILELNVSTQYYQLETGDLTPGVYFCELNFSNGLSQRLKFIKQ